MAQIKRYPFYSHLRSEAATQLQYFRKGKLRKSGRGLAFWFDPNGASIREIPMDDREMSFFVKGQSSDHQDIAVQGIVAWRVSDPSQLGDRVDYTISLKSGSVIGKPQDQIESVINGLVRQFADTYLKQMGVRALLEHGLAPLQAAIKLGFEQDPTLAGMGLEIVSIRVADLKASSELSRALQVPTFEALQQKADEATFSRRALAVEKERAIAENELNTKVELAARRQDLIAREDANARSEAEALVASERISVAAEAENLSLKTAAEANAKVIAAEAEATRIRAVEQAAADMEQARMDAVGSVPPAVLYAMAAQEFAGKLNKIENIQISPDMIAGAIGQIQSALKRANVSVEAK